MLEHTMVALQLNRTTCVLYVMKFMNNALWWIIYENKIKITDSMIIIMVKWIKIKKWSLQEIHIIHSLTKVCMSQSFENEYLCSQEICLIHDSTEVFSSGYHSTRFLVLESSLKMDASHVLRYSSVHSRWRKSHMLCRVLRVSVMRSTKWTCSMLRLRAVSMCDIANIWVKYRFLAHSGSWPNSRSLRGGCLPSTNDTRRDACPVSYIISVAMLSKGFRMTCKMRSDRMR